ncbi:MAG TPA: UDP-glucose/GDP-mannose dehydrogenase family protein [Patescibacteria group bacterium]|nr:UDP-glucose/GDP-mannose dehydrogenase family protein [Patescibacteria group bacterium]
MIVTIVGVGYVGLVSSAVFSDFGNVVFGLDVDEKRIERLQRGEIPFYEPGLTELVKRNLREKRLRFTTSYKDAVSQSDIVFICVGTPPKENGEADVTYIFDAAKKMAKYLQEGAIVVLKSTAPPSTTDAITRLIRERTKRSFSVAACPEFLREGSAVSDYLAPDRVVFGVSDEKSKEMLFRLHQPIKGERVVLDPKGAMMVKYASNAFLASKISFANAIANLCDRVGTDVKPVLDGLGIDRRIGRSFLYPGVGYGGSCFPKDVLALISIAKKYRYDFTFLKVVHKMNEEQIPYFIEKAEKHLGTLKNKEIAILGLSFKPNTDDLREAPSIKIITKLQKKGAKVTAYDPVAMENAKKLLKDVKYAKNPFDAVEGKDALFLVTEWNQFHELDLPAMKKAMRYPLLLDGRNFYDPDTLKAIGFIYEGVGR